MAFDYFCREELRVTDARPTEFDFSAWRMLSLMQHQLSQLCALMICGRAKIDRLLIIKDGARFEFSGALPTEDLIGVLSRMDCAEELKMQLECSTASVDVETAGLFDELDDMADSGNVLWDRIRFECLTCFGGKRRLYRYGIWDGKLLHGEVPQEVGLS